jgi:probable F420-dependent oxidoreductase
MTAPLEHWLPVMFTDVRQSVELARAAEAAGFTGIALADHVAVPVAYTSVHPSGQRVVDPDSEFPDPFVVAATMLAVTTRLKVMTYVYIVPMRDPWSVAKGAGTLSLLSGGRFGLGVGAGWLTEEIALLGHDPTTRGKRMDASLATIQSLLRTGRALDAHGGEVAMSPVPPVEPPIWVGGKSRVALRRAARYDGWLGMNYPMAETLDLLDQLAALRAEAGRVSPDAMTLALPIDVPTPALHEELAGRGATATLGMPWAPGDPAFADLGRKVAALEEWSAQFGLT